LQLLKHVIITYINPSRSLIPYAVHLILTTFEREESQTYPYKLSSKQGKIWYHFYNVVGMTRLGIDPTTSRSRGERSTTEPLLFSVLPYKRLKHTLSVWSKFSIELNTLIVFRSTLLQLNIVCWAIFIITFVYKK